MNKYTPVIGLEIHVELKTKSKMFCQCSADYFGQEPNSHVCPVCLGMPGALPVPNKKAVEWTILIGKALKCSINKISKFDRKHYFYPDLAKGYQISQYDEPLAVGGYIQMGEKRFHINRVHLEEDTGKLTHSGENTLIDFNRSSVPLVEIVTEPDFDNADDVKAFLEELHTIIRYLNVSDADMEKGSMRLEPNISVRLTGQKELPKYKVEVKNINSFRYVKLAIEHEVERHIKLLEEGTMPKQETRGFNETKGETYAQRSKEEAQDYRYFPEPDIPPMSFTDEYLASIFSQLPELPAEKLNRYVSELDIKQDDAFNLTRSASISKYFEEVVRKASSKELNQKIANAIVNKRLSIDMDAADFAQKVVELYKPKETDATLLNSVSEKVIAANPKAVADYKSGKETVIMFLVGQVMREMKGAADANTVKEALREKLK
ncbi:Asp-tRNA(Asn)/Glu-tRNA(Gln) amidotransferase subunit GatB [Candidatus Roizmanbacteria bacterium]|nr:Asp-tRNA(Asn)/Glu-tRNA(Gln) amidotransferase subunit GatB [Candidatus Roizmanbacteria bacterium]